MRDKPSDPFQQELAPDLEWMLQTSQAPREMILEAIVEEYYAPVWRLASALLEDAQGARRAALQALGKAAAQTDTYRGKTSVDMWLYQIVLDALEPLSRRISWETRPPRTSWEAESGLAWALRGLQPRLRAAAGLVYLFNWQPAQAARAARLPEARLEASFSDLRYEVAASLPASDRAAASPDLADAALRAWFRQHFPERLISPDEQEKALAEMAEFSASHSKLRRRRTLLWEFLAISLVLLAAASTIWGVNRLLPDTPPIQPTVLVTRIVLITPTPAAVVQIEPTPTPSALPVNATYIVRPGDTLSAVATRLDTSIAALQKLNRIPPGERLRPGQRLLNPNRWQLEPEAPATPVAPLNPAPALTEPYDSEQIMRRLGRESENSYATVWFDAQLSDYGPPGYIGPPRLRRIQAWLGVDRSLVVIGQADGTIEAAWLREGETILIARPGQPYPWKYEQLGGNRTGGNRGTSAADAVRLLGEAILSRLDLPADYWIQADGRETQAGLLALVVSQFDPSGQPAARIWLDDRTGLVLRKLIYGGQPAGPLSEVALTQVEYNVDFPADLLDPRLPWRGGFASGSNGESAASVIPWQASNWIRRPLADAVAPEGFDPASSRLYFQYRDGFNTQEGVGVASIFAAPLSAASPSRAVSTPGPGAASTPEVVYSLGGIVFGNPWELACARSPDGRWLAYVNQPRAGVDPDSVLNLLRLGQTLGRVQPVYSQMGVTAFAFSPDSRQVVFFGRTSRSAAGSLYLLDLDGEGAAGSGSTVRSLRQLARLGDAASLVWSPDGEEVALAARMEKPTDPEVRLVLSVEDGAVIYQGPENPNWPAGEWGVKFPVELGGLEACALPPASPATN